LAVLVELVADIHPLVALAEQVADIHPLVALVALAALVALVVPSVEPHYHNLGN